MTEVLVAGLCSATIWIGFRSYGGRDPVCVGRLRSLAVTRSEIREPRRARPLGILAYLGRRFPVGKSHFIEPAVSAGVLTDADVFRGAQLLGLFTGLLLGAVAGPLALLAAPAGAFLGFKLPHMLVSVAIRRRRDEVALALPDIIDLLAVCTQAGLNISLSLRRVSERASGVLGHELRRTLDEVDLGVPRTKALQGLADRVRSDDLDALVGVLLSAERFGTQVSVALETFAREVRARRRRRAEEQARRAPVKILFPLVFLILPAFIVLTVVPLLLSTFETLGI